MAEDWVSDFEREFPGYKDLLMKGKYETQVIIWKLFKDYSFCKKQIEAIKQKNFMLLNEYQETTEELKEEIIYVLDRL